MVLSDRQLIIPERDLGLASMKEVESREYSPWEKTSRRRVGRARVLTQTAGVASTVTVKLPTRENTTQQGYR